jgi:lipopolysaccharide/colanic/teichoic acid biosynthesis glycosyltransferase
MTYITTTETAPLRGASRSRLSRGKRVLDLGLTLLALVTLWPAIALIALAVRCTSPGPAFFVQTRVGRDGARFGMVKFRSMYADAEARRAALLAASDREGVCFKMRDDPRVTPLGRLLRRSSLDELPQLFNVLWGDMSLVGPRPALPQEVAEYPEHAMGRLAVLPGITGVWQVSGRAEVSFEDMVAMDLAYARSHSVAGDLAILWRTLGVVLTGRGAY